MRVSVGLPERVSTSLNDHVWECSRVAESDDVSVSVGESVEDTSSDEDFDPDDGVDNVRETDIVSLRDGSDVNEPDTVPVWLRSVDGEFPLSVMVGVIDAVVEGENDMVSEREARSDNVKVFCVND